MKDSTMMLLMGVLVLSFFGIGIAWTYLQWTECREAGMSILYCLKHIS